MTSAPAFEDAHHFPPEVLSLLVDTIPLICRSKREVIDFFRGAGAGTDLLRDWEQRLRTERDAVRKHEISRDILVRLNDLGEAAPRVRREIIKRVVEREDFSTCWPADQLRARGLVAQLRQVVNQKDAFTRMQAEREREAAARRQEAEKEKSARFARDEARRRVRDDLFGLFSDGDVYRRARKFEGVLGDLFQAFGIRIQRPFVLRSTEGGALEQIDGVVFFEGAVYLVEAKWWESPIGTAEVAQHLVRVFTRAEARAIIISASRFTEAAEQECVNALSQKLVILWELEEIVLALDRGLDLADVLRAKIDAATVERRPLKRVI
jgi:hypothetical protein